jgi:EipB-like
MLSIVSAVAMHKGWKMFKSGFLASVVFLSVGAQAATLAPHRAIYDLEVSRLDRNSGYSSIEGKLAYELTGSTCEGFAVNYRLANRYAQPEKPAQLFDTQLTTWESGDGLEMNLSQKNFLNSDLTSEERLNVKRQKKDGEGKGVMTKPKELEFTMPAEALFPSTHQMKLLDEAKQGLTRDASVVFDGSDNDKTYKAISFIGKLRAPGTFAGDKDNAQADVLRKMPSWPMTISYYSTEDKTADTPVYTASFNIYENGVSTDLLLDYGSYAMKGKLAKLDMLKADDCK